MNHVMICVMLHCERDNATSMQQQLLPELSGPRVLIFSLLVVPLDKTRQDPVVLPLDLARASCARTASHAPASPCTLAGRPIQTPYCRSPCTLQRKEKTASFVSVSLRLSRACLGKKRRTKQSVSRTATRGVLAHEEIVHAVRPTRVDSVALCPGVVVA